MFWALIVIAGLFAFYKLPAFRKTVLVIAATLALVIAGYFAYDHIQTAYAKTLVHATQLSFDDLRLGPSTYGSSYHLTGRIKNNSPYTVVNIQATIHIVDCDDHEKCEIVGESTENIAPVIPPGQVRDIDVSVYFSSDTRIHGRFQWNYTVGDISART